MIFKYTCHAVLLRNIFNHSHINSTIKLKSLLHQECRLFHVASAVATASKKKIMKKTIKKDLRDKTLLKVWENMTAEEFAAAMNIEFSNLKLLSLLKSYFPAVNLTPETKIKSFETYTFLARKLGYKFNIVKQKEEIKNKPVFKQLPSKPENLVKRPPVVTIMGHVDHGKTTLLDALRNSFVTEQEFGGITQHIGAFSVEVKSGEKITFIDTPGHAAFSAMRARGAEVTDIIVLVVAADDGVMQQTMESIRIALSSQVRLIIAVNKIDKPNALPMDDIKKRLLIEGVQVEDQGGDIQLVPISALKKINLDLLTEVILLEAELMNLRGDPTGFVEGVVIESKKGISGIVATLIVQRGTLQKEKIIVAGMAHAKVRRMLDENGRDYKEALPSTPVQVFGWRALPLAGSKVLEFSSEREAAAYVREIEKELMKEEQKLNQKIIEKKLFMQNVEQYKKKKILESAKTKRERRKIFFELSELQRKKEQEDEKIFPSLNVILKGDVYGTLEVLEDILGSYDREDECKLTVVESSVGDIKPSDLQIAEISDAVIYAFNVGLSQTVVDLVKEKNFDIRYHNVVYKLVDDLKEELSKRIPSKDEEKIIGEAEVIQNFIVTYSSKKVPVAGSKCTLGQLNRDSLFKVLRKDEVIYTGKIVEMRIEKKVVKTITKGSECGLMLDSFPDNFLPGDKIICYEMIEVQRKSTWNPGF